MVRIFFLAALGALSNLIAAGVSGYWQGMMVSNASRVRIELVLKQQAQQVAGTLVIGDEQPVPIEKAELQNDRLTFEIHSAASNLLKFRLTVSEAIISGESDSGGQVSKVALTQWNPRPTTPFDDGSASQPVLIRKTEPQYTAEARAANLQGIVVLSVEIEADGRISTDHIKVLRTLGMGLDEKAIECVKQWRFKPALKNGSPITVPAQVEVSFQLL